MKASEDLYSLIHSLSKPEKRFFKLHVSRYDSKEKNNYLKLFDAIEKQLSYDEQAIRQQFAKETFIKHLPSEKNYLYHLILDSLYIFHSEGTEEQKLKKRVEHARILFNRGLWEQSMKLLRKAREAAREQELYATLLDILQLEKLLMARNYYAGTAEEELKVIYEEEKECLARISEANEYWALFSRFYRLHYQKGSSRDAADREAIEAIMAHPLLENIDKASSFQTRLDYLHIHALYHFMGGEHARAYEFNRRYLALMESKPQKLKQFSKRYMATLNNYLMDSLGLRYYEDVRTGLDKLKALPQQYSFFNTRNMPADVFRLSSILELNLYIKTGNFKEGVKRSAQISAGLRTHGDKIAKHNLLTIYYLMAYLHFGAEKYSEAVRWLNNIINDTEEEVLQDIHAFARIFSLIIHYELQNYDIMDYLHASTQRYLARRNKFYQAETILLKYLRKLADTAGKKESQALFGKLKAELEPLRGDEAEKKAFEYFDLVSWLESKTAGRPFGAIVEARDAALA